MMSGNKDLWLGKSFTKAYPAMNKPDIAKNMSMSWLWLWPAPETKPNEKKIGSAEQCKAQSSEANIPK